MIFDLIKRKTETFLKLFSLLIKPYYFGFIEGHQYLTEIQVDKIKSALINNEENFVDKFETIFSELIGNGKSISFASGRMAFYSLMLTMGIGKDDEVILPGFTCSVMPNAVLRLGARPVFSDIDKKTFGSDPVSIEENITARTKLIVAQHSFGIPCEIDQICEIGKKYNIPVVEDCAITLDSSYKGIKAGNWGIAAIFSTDHSKPVNTLIGGLLYTKDLALFNRIQDYSKSLPDLSLIHQENLFKRFLFERKFYNPAKYHLAIFIEKTVAIKRKFFPEKEKTLFLQADYYAHNFNNLNYPYPAKMPAFAAALGIFELENWKNKKIKRQKLLKKFINLAKGRNMSDCLPNAYFSGDCDIVPLRFVFTYSGTDNFIKNLAKAMDINWFWFKSPVISCPEGPESFGYKYGSCPVSEQVGLNIINFPCNIPEDWEDSLLEIFSRV